MSYGVGETSKGYTVCLLQEDGVALRSMSKPFTDRFDARTAARIRNAAPVSPLAASVTAALMADGIFEPLGVSL